ncbi:MAG: DUF4825 domain-containing protein [Clostridia bacterium]|nr:DUF4825 domain-containing protein [Clostridia bacterium]
MTKESCNEISCNIIKDLLPLYIEGLTSEESNSLIEEHLKECEACRELYEEMKKDMCLGVTGEESSDFKENLNAEAETIDFMKKSNKKLRLGFGFGLVAVIALCLCLLLARGYFNSYSAPLQLVEISSLRVEEGNAHIDGYLKDSSQGVKDVAFSYKDGELSIEIMSGMKTAFSENDFYSDFSGDEKIKTVKLADRVIWENGCDIPAFVADVYAAAHSYIGNMPENGQSVKALGVVERFGNFTNELQTSNEPYGWTLHFEEDMGRWNEEKLKVEFGYYGAMLIATIDNLGYVNFEYAVDGEAHTFSIDEKAADAHYGSSVKEAAKTAEGLYYMMKAW